MTAYPGSRTVAGRSAGRLPKAEPQGRHAWTARGCVASVAAGGSLNWLADPYG